jgi:hypothetical protein
MQRKRRPAPAIKAGCSFHGQASASVTTNMPAGWEGERGAGKRSRFARCIARTIRSRTRQSSTAASRLLPRSRRAVRGSLCGGYGADHGRPASKLGTSSARSSRCPGTGILPRSHDNPELLWIDDANVSLTPGRSIQHLHSDGFYATSDLLHPITNGLIYVTGAIHNASPAPRRRPDYGTLR